MKPVLLHLGKDDQHLRMGIYYRAGMAVMGAVEREWMLDGCFFELITD
jgi:hypothetical protein